MRKVRNWNDGGYDETITDRWLYAVAIPNDTQVKIGMVLDEDRLPLRLKELRRNHRQPRFEMIAQSVVQLVHHEETEHIESAVRLWLTRACGFSFIGKVDWLRAPSDCPQNQWQNLLDTAVRASLDFGKPV